MSTTSTIFAFFLFLDGEKHCWTSHATTGKENHIAYSTPLLRGVNDFRLNELFYFPPPIALSPLGLQKETAWSKRCCSDVFIACSIILQLISTTQQVWLVTDKLIVTGLQTCHPFDLLTTAKSWWWCEKEVPRISLVEFNNA